MHAEIQILLTTPISFNLDDKGDRAHTTVDFRESLGDRRHRPLHLVGVEGEFEVSTTVVVVRENNFCNGTTKSSKKTRKVHNGK